MRAIHSRALNLRWGFPLLPADARNIRRGKNIYNASIVLDYDPLPSDKNVIRMWHWKVRPAGKLDPKWLERNSADCFSNVVKHVPT